MEKWKIVIIGLLVAGLFGYGFLSQRPVTELPTAVTPPAEVLGANLQPGVPVIPWKLTKASDWINTPKPVRLSDLAGGISLIEVFRIECSHCQETAPLMVAIAQRYVPRGLKVVGIQSPGQYKDATNDENDWTKVKAWCRDKGITYPVGFDPGSAYFQKTMKGTYYPTIMLTTPANKIQFAQTGHDMAKGLDLAAAVEKAFPGPGTPRQRAEDLAHWLTTVPEYHDAGGSSLVDALQARILGKSPAVRATG